MSEAATTNESLSARLRGFGPAGLTAILVILAASAVVSPLGAVAVLGWAALSQTPLRELGYVREKAGTLALAAAAGVVFKLALKTIVMPLLGGPAVNPAYHWIAGNTAA